MCVALCDGDSRCYLCRADVTRFEYILGGWEVGWAEWVAHECSCASANRCLMFVQMCNR